MKNKKLVNTINSALFAAIVCITTMLVKIATPNGYVNMGDCFVILSGWYLGPCFGFLSAAVGSMLADILNSYAVYAPATFVIKGLMAFACYIIFTKLQKTNHKTVGRIVSSVFAALIMIIGYFAFESLYYGNIPAALVSALANIGQGAFGIITSVIVAGVIDKNKFISNYLKQ